MEAVVTLCGSLRAGSANGAALDVVEGALGDRGVGWVRFDGLAGVAPFSPEWADQAVGVTRRWMEAVVGAAGFVVAAPEYAGSLAGTTKNALDWLVGAAGLYEKPVLMVSAGTTGGRFAREELLRTLTWQGAFVVAEVGIVAAAAAFDEDRRLIDPEAVASLRRGADELVAALDEPIERRAERRDEVQRRLARGIGGA